MTADCGTSTACSSPATTWARTNWPGSSASSGLANSARICTVPSLASTVEEVKLRRPLPAITLPSACTSLTSAFFANLRNCAYSLSANEKRTQIGLVCTTVVSRALSVPAVTRLPSERWARPVTPAIGALTAVYDRLSSASRNLASAAARVASDCFSVEVASSYSF